MISYLVGKIEFKDEKIVIIETNGIGYQVFCSSTTLEKIQIGKEIKIFTYLHVKEDAMELYGFLTREDLNLFEILNNLSGVGPKTATMLTSLGSLAKLKEVIENGELPSEIKGIGRKKSQKILLELTGKIKEINIAKRKDFSDEALDGLVSLGFTKQRAKDALDQVSKDVQGVEDRIKKALEILGKK